MALNLKLADALVNAQAAAMNALFNGGKLQLYDGAQAANADTAIGAQNKLVEWTLPTPCWGSPTAGVVSAEAITDVVAIDDGDATWFRVVSSGGTKLMDGSVGTSLCNLNLDTITIVTGVTQHVTSWTHTIPKA
jgi:hypothetical protein